MTLTNIIKQKRSAITILISSMALGLAYPLVADSGEDWVARVNGFLVGLFGGLAIVIFELYLFYFPKRIQSFIFTLSAKVITYTLTFVLLIVITISITRSVENHIPYFTFIQSEHFLHFIFKEDFHIIAAYTLTAVFIVITTRQVSRKMGPGELFNYIVGKYHTPKKEHRIFLAIDLISSTNLAEQLGELTYHEFLKQYFYDLTASIALHEGHVYRYVGDQVMISWLLPTGLRNNNAVKCFFSAQEYIKHQKNLYVKNFGTLPTFRGALDMGEVLTAEIGLDKKQLVFYGDVIDRLGVIEKACKQKNLNLLLSEYLAVPLRQTRDFTFTFCEEIKSSLGNSVKLYSANPIEKGTENAEAS
jgi:adenylate cyclase